MSKLDSYVTAARDRQSPWDAARSERVLEQALTTRATRARKRATRFTVATACGAILVLGFGLRGLVMERGAFNAASAQTSTAQVTTGPNGTVEESNEAPSPAELASLARNDGGYGRD